MPYTLPGVLALIGWWWYISRKKERLICHDNLEGAPTTMGLKLSTAEGSNGLVEKGSVSPTNDSESQTHKPHKVSNQRKEHENISQSHVQDNDAALSLEKHSEEAAAHVGRIRLDEVHKPSVSTPKSPGKEDSWQVLLEDHEDPEESSSLVLAKELEKQLVKDQGLAENVVFSCQLIKITSSSPKTPHLSDSERPEPEGEVAKHHTRVNAQNEMVACTDKVQRVIPLKTNSLETPPSVQNFHQHILTSTPTFLDPNSIALTMVQDSASSPVITEDFQVHSSNKKEVDLELLASGLITEVISAATQEVLGVISSQVTDNSQPSCSSSTSVGSGRLTSQQELVTVAQQHHHHLLTSPSQMGSESRVAREVEEPGVPNGCSLLSHRVHQTNSVQIGHWQTSSYQATESAHLLNMKLKGNEGVIFAEDSACSTCHSEDGISSEDIQNSVSDSHMDVIQVTDLSEREATQHQSLVETTTEATVLAESKEVSMNAVCEIKRLNGMGIRNGGHGTCEVETDQSGGKTSVCSIGLQV